ncbi:MAG: hypothetical protein SGI90_03890 [Candidatus Eisenbacteria bacterium]|nr:hypothetical protein [Candidatus Eisenbacteria bacterium]
MGRRYGVPFLVLALGLVVAPVSALAGVPDPALSTIPNVLGSPNGGLAYRVTIVGTSGPIDSANVTLVWTVAGDTATCWCSTQTHPSVSSTTNASGVAVFNLRLGRCLNPATIPGGVAVEVFINSIKIKEVGQVSPDLTGTALGPPCEVALNDAVQFTFPLSTATYGYCFDLNSDGTVGLSDATLLTAPVATAATCN